jgi:Tellurite resistance protein TehB
VKEPGWKAPWDIGEPQPEVVKAAEEGLLNGAVLDAGCGLGENAIYLTAKGLKVPSGFSSWVWGSNQ